MYSLSNLSFSFQLTRSRGAWPRTRGSMGQQCRFQLTRSRGAWLRPAEIAPSARDFNSHAHVERDVFNPLFVCVMFDFNSHAHVERDFFVCTRSHSIFRFQLTRSRGAWPSNKNGKSRFKKISTHTLTWSVTGIWNFCKILYKFQLTRSRGAWLAKFKLIS